MGGIWGTKKQPEPELDFGSLFEQSHSAQEWEARLVEMAVQYFRQAHRITLSQDKMALQRLRDGAGRVRQELGAGTSARLHLPFLAADASGPKELDWTITRRPDQRVPAAN